MKDLMTNEELLQYAKDQFKEKHPDADLSWFTLADVERINEKCIDEWMDRSIIPYDPYPEFPDYDNLTPEQQADIDAWEDRQEKYNYEVFIEQMVMHGNRRIAYQRAYPGTSDASARTGAWRLMMHEGIARRIQQQSLQMKQEAMQVLKEQYNGRIADIQEKREILAQIIRGELVPEKQVIKNGETFTTRQTCDPKERIRAILADNKLEEEWRAALILPDAGMKHLHKA